MQCDSLSKLQNVHTVFGPTVSPRGKSTRYYETNANKICNRHIHTAETKQNKTTKLTVAKWTWPNKLWHIHTMEYYEPIKRLYCGVQGTK